MNKLKMLALTALGAATVGIGALAAAPSASAMRARTVDCGALAIKAKAYGDTATILLAQGSSGWAAYYAGLATAYYNMLSEYG